MSQIHSKKKICIRVTEVCSYNKSFNEFIKTRGSEELRDMLTSCLNSSTIVKNNEGQTFISRIVSNLGPDVHDELVNIIKTLVPKLSSNLLMCYGMILYRIWLEYANQNDKDKMQNFEEIIQRTFCMGSIRLNPMIALRMRLILHSFHNSRDDFRVNKLLVRLYDPIIWRYLSVANWKVRLNTTALLAILFPLIDPSLSTREYNYELDHQFSILQNLLIDNNSEVRVAAIQSVCRILTLYWEITPIERIHEVLSTLSSRCIEDKNSNDVRAAVINGISIIVNNPLSQNIIKRYLPKIFTYLHDFDIEVRYSVALLILKISRIKGFDYSQIISKKQILSRISKEFIIYQVRQSSYYMKYGKLHDNSKIVIKDVYSDDQNLVFESLKVARVLAELLNHSIYNVNTKEQLKNCYLFCDLCPIGMVGYFCCLKILVDETVGKNIENSDLLRLAVLLITTTVENYKKNRITYNKAKILLASSKEILSTVFSSNIFLAEMNNEVCSSPNAGREAKGKAIQTAIKFFTSSCNDEFFLRVTPNDKIWVSMLQLLQYQAVFSSNIYPMFSKKVVSEIWNSSLTLLKDGFDEENSISHLEAAILLSKDWELLDGIIPILVNGSYNILNNTSTVNQLCADLETKLTPKNTGILCIKILVNIFKYSHIRIHISNHHSTLSYIECLANHILKFQMNETLSEFEGEVMKLIRQLSTYCFAIIKNEDTAYELISKIIREIDCITNQPNRSSNIFLSLLEFLSSALCIININTYKIKEMIEGITKLSKSLSVIITDFLEMNKQDEVFIYRFRRGVNTYLFALKQIIGSSCFESDIFIKEIRSKLDTSL